MAAEAAEYAWTRDFELAVLRQMVADPLVMQRAGAHVDAARFPSEDGRLAAEAIVGYWKRLGHSPTSVAAIQEARGWQEAGKRDASVVRRVAGALDEALDAVPADTAYVVERVCAEARRQALWGALDDGLRLWGQGRLDDVPKAILAADRIGKADFSPGVDWGGSLAQRTDDRKNRPDPPRWGTGVVELDDCLRGGLAAGELGVFVAAPGSGKTTALVTVASHVMNLGGTVVYYSLEMHEQDLVDRIDSCVTRVPIADLKNNAGYVQGEVEEWLRRSGGSCVVKEFPARTTSTADVRAHLHALRAEKSVSPTLLIFDYADKMASGEPGRYEKDYQVVGAVYDEIRNLGGEFGCPVWTASQTNAEGDEAKVAGGHHVARSREKFANADVMISINRTEDEKVTEQVRLHMIKVRYAPDGQTLGPLRSDYGRGRLVSLDRRAVVE